MATTRGARPFAANVYDEEDEPSDRVDVRPHAPDDRAYLILMYQEHAHQARHQDLLRTIWAVVTVGLAASLVGVAATDDRALGIGSALCCVGVFGGIAIVKCHERYELHLRVMRGFRGALAEAVRSDLPRISFNASIQHNKRHRVTRVISLQGFWLLACAAMVSFGAFLIWRASLGPTTNMTPAMSAPGRTAAPSAAPMPAPGDELP